MYEAVIGLEIHAQLATQSKLFCSSGTDFGSQPNKHISPVTLGLPGALPVLNKQAVLYAIMAGIALNCDIQKKSIFARKNYFYPDLPKGYQISQYEYPLCLGGYIGLDDGSTIGITRIHMEEDAGKLIHQGADGIAGSSSSLVDLNRAGVPLIEIVSEPDIRTPEQARLYMMQIHQLLTFIGVCDGDLEKGSFRCDANVSIRTIGCTELGTRTEVKNLNSFRSVERAITYEIERQKQCVLEGQVIRQQTLHFDDVTGKTTVLRDKENAHDYRYFPDPDLKPLWVTQTQIDDIKSALPELPAVVKKRYVTVYQLPDHDVKVLLQEKRLYVFFEKAKVYLKKAPPKVMSKWLVGPLHAVLKERGHDDTITIDPSDFAQAIDYCHEGVISTKMLKESLPKLQAGERIQSILDKQGGGQIANSDELEGMVQTIMKQHPDVVEKIKNGKIASANFLMGQVMKVSQGRAKPDTVRELILQACEVTSRK